jgi:outer membrane immunogenic protein
MKKSILGLVAIGALIAAPAMAADLRMPVKAPPAPIVPVFSWTGLYLGINGGGGWGREDWVDNSSIGIPPGAAVRHRPDGGMFGGTFGFRYQLNSNIVIGVEGMADWADLNDTVNTSSVFFPVENETLKVKSLYSATGQIGYAWSQALLYVKGGWAGANTTANINATTGAGVIPGVGTFTPFTASNSQNDSGWTVGVGLDYALINNFVIGVEYDHYDLGYASFSAAASNGGVIWSVTNPSRMTIDSVVGRLTYNLNLGGFGGGPVAARY